MYLCFATDCQDGNGLPRLKKLGQYSQILSSCLVKVAERGKEKLNQPDNTD